MMNALPQKMKPTGGTGDVAEPKLKTPSSRCRDPTLRHGLPVWCCIRSGRVGMLWVG